jgi:O-antigen/teichoic acid export membrane protein
MIQRILQFLKDPTAATLAKGSSVVLIFKIIGALGGYVLLWSLGQAGGEKAVGVYEVAFTLILIASTVGRWGLDTVLVKELGKTELGDAPSRGLYGHIFVRVLAITAALSILTFFAAEALTELFFNQTPVGVLRTASLTALPFTLMLLNAEAYRGLHKPVLFSINQHGTVYLILAALLWWVPMESAGFDAEGSAQFALLLLLGISSAFALLSTVHVISLCERKPWRGAALAGNLMKVATPMLVSSALFLVMSWSDTLMLSYFLEEDEVGVYRIVFKIATLITFAQFALNTVVAPMISGLHNGGSNMSLLAQRIATLNLVTAGPIFLGIIALGPFLIGLFGVNDPWTAYPWLVILACGQLANAFAGPVLNILNMTGHEKSAQNTMLVVATLNIILNAVLIPAFGPGGAAVATAMTMVGWNIWAGVLVYRFHGIITVPFLAKRSRS